MGLWCNHIEQEYDGSLAPPLSETSASASGSCGVVSVTCLSQPQGIPFQEILHHGQMLYFCVVSWSLFVTFNYIGSGWLRIELAVLVDDRAEVIASEAWPPYPATQYPNRHRRLQDDPLIKGLAKQYPQTQVTSEPDGSITLLIPDPQQIVAKAKADALAAQQQALILAMSLDTSDDETTSPSLCRVR